MGKSPSAGAQSGTQRNELTMIVNYSRLQYYARQLSADAFADLAPTHTSAHGII